LLPDKLTEVLVLNKKRPVNLDIGTIQLPVTAYVSILHRVSGVVLFGVVGLFLWILDLSLSSEESFNSIKELMNSLTVQIIIWLSLAALIYHLVAGLRHLVMDYGYGETLSGGILGAKLVLLLSAVLMLMAGFWLWI
jgi:succinate dehydrogenase / fumarate reductase cytochrome b subunit|tara:strand:- start:29568 stop:29978 length:411 start_codon:yes stop_codon:yes gene_type:complete